MSDMPFKRDFDPRYGESVEVAPLIRRVVCNNPTPFTFRGTATHIVGRGDVAVIDPGPEDEAHLQALRAALDGERVSAILVTHGHRDHVGGLAAFREATGAPVIAGPVSQPRTMPPAGEGPSGGVPADRLLAEGETVEGDGWRLEAIATPGHAADHVAFALSDSEILFPGDHVMGWSTTTVSPPGGHMASYLASLRKLIARPERLYLPAHGAPIADGPAYARGLLAHRQAREAAILDRLRGGDRSIEAIVAALYRGLDPRLVRAAGLSVLAHVEHLIERGLAASDGGVSAEAEFRAT